jgi:PAS domain S-box-containing protein
MTDNQKTKEELIKELGLLRQQVTDLEDKTTEQQLVIKALLKSEEQYELVFNNSSIGIIYFDTDGTYIMLNDYIAKQLGGEPKDFVGKTLHEVLPDVADFHLKRFNKIIHERKGVMFEDSFVLETGTYWYSSYLHPVIDNRNEVVGIQITSVDITERKRMEEQLRYQSTLIDMISDAIISTDMSFVVQTWNPAAEAMYGWTAEEVIGKPMADFINAEYPNLSREEVLSEFATSGNFSGEVIHHHKDGIPIHLWGKVTMFHNDKGVPIGAVSVNRDITQRKTAEDALRESEENMAEAQQIAQLGSWKWSVQTGDTYWSDEMYRMYHVDKAETSLNEIVRDIIHPDDLETFDKAMSNTAAGNVVDSLEYRIVTEDGSIRHIRATGRPSFDTSGKLIQIVGSAQDITERIKLEALAVDNERLKIQFQKEQEQNKLIQRIISTLSHDMRTPLTLITLSKDTLKLYYDKLDEDKRNEILTSIHHQTQFALQLLEDTVLMARGQHGFNPKPVNIASLCQVSIDEIFLAEAKQHTLKFNNKGNVKTVTVDETLVSRILLNLISNAIKYSPDGGEICLELNEYENGITLSISDQGMGISNDDIPYVFDQLYRAGNVDSIQGTGLGLTIVKDCVERHQGKITVQSELGKGTIFLVQLPVSTYEPPVLSKV